MDRPQLDTPLDPRHLRERVEDEYNEKLRTEYQGIMSYMPTLQDLPPGTKAKNRYVNVLPNEETRVRLAQIGDDATSTFINANYVRGFKGFPKRYIATQGPLPDTMNDFWRMIWEESIVCIVMTTGLIEGKRRKCDRYWPEHPQTQGQYGNVTVNVLDEVDSGPWVLSTFRVDNGSETRTVKHFWYTGWPDHGVPETARDVIEFLRAVKEETGTSKAPILVHCSAGIGRTGTFMAIDIGMQELQSEWRVTDIRGNVENAQGPGWLCPDADPIQIYSPGPRRVLPTVGAEALHVRGKQAATGCPADVQPIPLPRLYSARVAPRVHRFGRRRRPCRVSGCPPWRPRP